MKMARRVGQDANRPFPWVVNDFGLVDAIESGLVNIPQLAVRDTSGSPIPGYFNIWRWILPRLTPAERGGRRGRVKPEAVLKYSHVPVAMLGGLWEVLRRAWSEREDEPRPPVFIIVCNDTALAKVVYRWLAEDEVPVGIPPARLDGLHNTDGDIRTIRVDSKVVRESDDGGAKSDADRWMRLTLDTVGKTDWSWDTQRRPIYPDGFEALAKKLERPFHPPGRDVRCIVSVGMLAEGWDCNTVTHIVGLRPFMSQLLCEQVVGRGLRRSSYAVGDDGKLGEEVAKIFGVPFEIVPLKENPAGNESRPPPKIWPIHALPERAELEIRFPRVERYMQRIRHRLKVDWDNIAPLCLDPMDIPPEVEMKAGLPSNTGRPALVGPGRLERVDLNPYREGRRLQKLVFEMARDLTRDYRQPPHCDAPAHVIVPPDRSYRRPLSQGEGPRSTTLSSSPPRGSCSGPSRSRCAASCLSSATRRRCGIPRWCSSSRRCPSAHILLAILPSLPAPDRTISTAISTAKCPRSHRPRIRQQPCHRPYQYSPINADRPFVSPIRLDHRVLDDAARANAHPITENDVTFQHDVDVDEDVDSGAYAASDVDSRGIGDACALAHEGFGETPLVEPLQCRELHAVVDAEHLLEGFRRHRSDRHAFLDRKGDDIGEVVLALRVVAAHALEPTPQVSGTSCEYPRVDLRDVALLVACIPLFDDAADMPVRIPNDSPVSARVVDHRGDERNAAWTSTLIAKAGASRSWYSRWPGI